MGNITHTRNIDNLERTQKTFAKLILKEKYKNYKNALIILDLDTLQKRRHDQCIKFAKIGIKNNNLNDLFPQNKKEHKMQTRDLKKYKVNFANTERYKKSSIISMQNMLNEEN